MPDAVSTASRNGHKVAALAVPAGALEKQLGQGPTALELLSSREKMEKELHESLPMRIVGNGKRKIFPKGAMTFSPTGGK